MMSNIVKLPILVFTITLLWTVTLSAQPRDDCKMRLVRASGPEKVIATPHTIRFVRNWAGNPFLDWLLKPAARERTDAFQDKAVGDDISIYLGDVTIMADAELHERINMIEVTIPLSEREWARYQPKLARCAQVDLSALTPLPVDTTGLFATGN